MRTRYHKKQQQFDRSNPIYRLLPTAVGEAVVYYNWLVLPFYHMVYNNISNRQTPLNPYLLTDHFTLSLEHPGLSGAGAPGFDPEFCASHTSLLS